MGAVAFTSERLPNGDDQSSSFVESRGQYTTFTYPNSDYSEALGINDTGTIVGEYRNSAVPGNIFSGYLAQGEGISSFQIVPSATSSFGYSINDAGDTAGGYRVSNGDIEGFVDVNGTPSTVSLGNQTFTTVTAINNSNDYAGFYYTGSEFQGFYDINGVLSTFSVPGSTYTVIEGMNDLGDVVGNYFEGSGARHGFVYDPYTMTMTPIEFPGAPNGSYATGINDSGDVVGAYQLGGDSFGFETRVPVPEPGSLALLATGLLALSIACPGAKRPRSRTSRPTHI